MANLESKALENNMCTNIPLVVDLDGTLIYEDTTIVLLKKLSLEKPVKIGSLFSKLYFGRAVFKVHLSNLVTLDITKLKYNEKLLEWLFLEKKQGRVLILCSGAPKDVVEAVCEEFKIFSEYHSSTSSCNLTGKNKAKLLVSRYGSLNFDYVGNSSDDCHVWREARHCIIANVDKSVRKKLKKFSIKVFKEF